MKNTRIFLFLIMTAIMMSCKKPMIPLSSEQAVLVHFDFGSRDIRELHNFEERLHSLLTDKSIGKYDGHDISADGSDTILYFYGPDAKKLFEYIKPILRETSFLRKAQAKLRYGGVNDTAARIEIVQLGNN